MRLEGKVVLITASTRGIGLATVKACAKEGAKVYMAARNLELAKSVADELNAEGGNVKYVYNDATKEETFSTMVEEVVEKEGRIDVLVNNFGTSNPREDLDLAHTDVNVFINTVNINLKSVFIASQAAVKEMAKTGGGSIINIGSVNKTIVTVGETVYATTKAGISKMTENLAREWGPSGIRVNCIAPGSIPTLMNQKQYSDIKVHQAMCDKLPLRRRGEADEIADGVLFMASPYASYITGQTLFIDGGLTIVCG